MTIVAIPNAGPSPKIESGFVGASEISAEDLPESVLICGAKSCILQRARPPSRFINQLVSLPIRGYEPAGREFESLRARQNLQLIQALTTVAGAAFCFNNTSAGLLRDCTAHTLFVASIRFSNSAAEYCVVMRPDLCPSKS